MSAVASEESTAVPPGASVAVEDTQSRGVGAAEPVAVRTAEPAAIGPPGSTAAGAPPRLIEPPAKGMKQMAADYWRWRHAYGYFVRMFLRKRYGRTFLGYLWFFIPVLFPMLMGALVFGGILGVDVGVPYLLYFCIATSTWFLFAQTAYFATRSLEITRSELRKLYFPRLIVLSAALTLPLAAVVVYTLVVLAATGFYVIERGEFYLVLGPATLLVPVALVMLVVYAIALGLWFSPLAPRARDVRRIAGYVLGFWYFLTPVIYTIDKIPADWQFVASLNPITAPLEMVKNGLLDIGDVTALGLATYGGSLVVVAIGGALLFSSKERRDMATYY